jgi:hypothetical protein
MRLHRCTEEKKINVDCIVYLNLSPIICISEQGANTILCLPFKPSANSTRHFPDMFRSRMRRRHVTKLNMGHHMGEKHNFILNAWIENKVF